MTRLLIAAAILSLTACSPEVTQESLCNDLIAGDPEAASEMARDGISPAAFCACYGGEVQKQAESIQEKHAAVFSAIIEIREKNNLGVDDAADLLERQLNGPANPHSFSEADFDAVGSFLNKTQNLLENAGTCSPA